MTDKQMQAAARRVVRGARLLEKKSPGWERRVDLNNFAFDDPKRCVLGWVFKDFVGLLFPVDGVARGSFQDGFNAGNKVLGLGYNWESYGFDVIGTSDTIKEYEVLGYFWTKLIKARRKSLKTFEGLCGRMGK